MSLAKSGTEYLWQGDPTWWPRRAPVLFPIVGNIRNDRAHSAQGGVTLKRHGLARNLEFTPLDASKGALALGSTRARSPAPPTPTTSGSR